MYTLGDSTADGFMNTLEDLYIVDDYTMVKKFYKSYMIYKKLFIGHAIGIYTIEFIQGAHERFCSVIIA